MSMAFQQCIDMSLWSRYHDLNLWESLQVPDVADWLLLRSGLFQGFTQKLRLESRFSRV